jgi:hypothetical protein
VAGRLGFTFLEAGSVVRPASSLESADRGSAVLEKGAEIMSDKSEELGRSIKQAIACLSQYYQDTDQMLAALDGLMANHQWRPTEKTRISWSLSNGMDPKRWVLRHLFRWYIPPTESLKSIQTLIAFFICFTPSRIFDQPIVLATAARFPSPVGYEVLFQQWTNFDQAVEALGEKPGPRKLTLQEVKPLLPSAGQVVGTVIPLSSLSSMEVLQSHCVDPIFKELSTLGN